MRAWFAGLLAAVAVVWSGSPVRAADAPAAPKGPFVVLAGVGQFQDKAIDPRPTAAADARALAKLFADPKHLHTTPDRVVLLTADPKEGERKATRENIVKALHEAVAETGKDDTIIIGLFGRGASVGEDTAFFTADATFKERAKTALLGSDLVPDLKLAKDRKVCLLMDVSFKGFDAGKEKLAVPSLRDVLKAVFAEEDDGNRPPPRNKVVFLSTVPSHTPLTKGDHGLFAATVLDALNGAADAEGNFEGYEPDGKVTIDELNKYLDKHVLEQARKIGKTNEEKEAVPFVIGEETSHFAVALNPAAAPKAEARLKALAEMDLPKDVAAEGKRLLAKMPKLKYQQELRKKYQALADGTLTRAGFDAGLKAIRDGLKLNAEETEKYARKVRRAIDLVKQKYVKELSPGEWAAFAVHGLYRGIDEPVPEDVAKKLETPKGLTEDEIDALLQSVRGRLGKREDLEGDKAVDVTVLRMLVETHDPYTTYFDRETIKKMDAPLRGEFRGVGIHIRQDLVRDGLLVVSPIKGSPAYRAGIQANDLIVEIRRTVGPQGEELKPGEPRVISTKGMKTEKAIELILGKVDVPITLVIQRDREDGTSERKEFELKRDRVSVETVMGVKRDAKDDWEFYIDPEKKIGYVCLTQFSPNTAIGLDQAIRKMQRAGGINGLVLDLRFNPGGLLTQAVAVSDLFLETTEKPIVTVRYRYKPEEPWLDQGLRRYVDFPMVVLVNGSSASAAEIVSAALRDHGRAKICGVRSYGKGSVQNVEDFPATGAQIKLTTARYFPPSNSNIDKLSTSGKETEEWGVKPSEGLEVKLSREQLSDLADYFREREVIKPHKEVKKVEDPQLDKAVEYLRSKIGAAANKGGKNPG
ncbi:MAG TPA: S41 family peptidase [Fimbriiglobus sp.]|nr:S41 family peptidase [Fimbriiglobus sp.]